MKGSVKLAIVAGAYVAAGLVAFLAVWIQNATTTVTDPQASAGMMAFGDAVLFLLVLGIASVPATGLALFFLISAWRARSKRV